MKHYLLLMIAATFLFASCSNDEADMDIPNRNDVMSFTYNGILYTSTYKMLKDSTIVMDDKMVEAIYEEISELPELAILFKEDGSEEYFTNNEKLLESLKNQNATKNALSERSYLPIYITGGSVALFEHDNMKGKSFSRSFSARDVSENYISNLNNDLSSPGPTLPIIFGNNILTSFRFICDWNVQTGSSILRVNKGMVTLFDQVNYKGRSIAFVLGNSSAPRLEVNHLKNYKRTSGGFLHKKRTWNDAVCSLKVDFFYE